MWFGGDFYVLVDGKIELAWKCTFRVSKIDLKVGKKLFSNFDFDQRMPCGAPVCWLKYTTQLPKFYDSKGITNLSLSEYLLPHVHIMLRLFSVPEVPGSKAWPYFWRSCLCSHIVTIFLPDSGDVSSSNKDNKVIKI